jgi:hypothetical protein
MTYEEACIKAREGK